jgi:hypothetical protein
MISTIYEMAAVGGGFNNIKLAIFGNESNYPHFHFYRVNDTDGIPKNGYGGGCIMIREPKYFIHGNHKEKLKRKEPEALIEFLNSHHPKLKISIWSYIIILWNDNNPKFEIKDDIKIPEYYLGMLNYRD